MFYFFLAVIGGAFIALSAKYFFQKQDTVGWVSNLYSRHYSTADISISIPLGNLNLTVNRQDRISAWKIYNQINTRIAAVDFNENYDSLYNVHQSLHQLFGIIREELSNIPVERLKDENSTMADFYHDILNQGIRPYLSKWHIPLSHFIEQNQKSGKSLLEIEKDYPEREKIIKDIKAMNFRMKIFSTELMKIVKG